MCGVCGNFNFTKKKRIDPEELKKMVSLLHHRGPDESGMYIDGDIGLGNARLSIVDLFGGRQPIHNEDKTIWTVFNGEIYNYPELRERLLKKGHVFYTHTDTEVLVHLYEEKGTAFLNDLNGQFAFAVWDKTKRRLMLARDRAGIRPLFYTIVDGSFLFASEVKSILTDRRVKRELDLAGLNQFFSFWATLPPRTTFKDISELPPAHFLVAQKGNVTVQRYWDLDYPLEEEAKKASQSFEYYAEHLLHLLEDAVAVRLRADVPVASYVSGGIDSSFISVVTKKNISNTFKTFSVGFEDKDYDERPFQREIVDFLNTEHHTISCTYDDIGNIMPDIIWHTEKPLIRTAPAPLYFLSKLVRDNNIKVVLTGEGADEMLAGYDLFRETKIRRFWAQNPGSRCRPQLLKKLYHYVPAWPRRASSFLESFYRADVLKFNTPWYSHMPRWHATAWIKSLFSDAVRAEVSGHNVLEDFNQCIPDGFSGWEYMSRAQYIEMITLLSGNLLSSQGDRMMMAHSVEGRFPFLDHRVMEFCARIPANMKLKVLNEKYILKRIASPMIPSTITERTKQGYRAPDSASFFGTSEPEYIADLLSRDNIRESGYFDADSVEKLVQKLRTTDNALISARYNMAAVGIISTLLVHKLFIKSRGDVPDGLDARVKSVRNVPW